MLAGSCWGEIFYRAHICARRANEILGSWEWVCDGAHLPAPTPLRWFKSELSKVCEFCLLLFAFTMVDQNFRFHLIKCSRIALSLSRSLHHWWRKCPNFSSWNAVEELLFCLFPFSMMEEIFQISPPQVLNNSFFSTPAAGSCQFYETWYKGIFGMRRAGNHHI